MNGRRVRWQDRQTVVDGSGEGAVSRNGETGYFAEGKSLAKSLEAPPCA